MQLDLIVAKLMLYTVDGSFRNPENNSPVDMVKTYLIIYQGFGSDTSKSGGCCPAGIF